MNASGSRKVMWVAEIIGIAAVGGVPATFAGDPVGVTETLKVFKGNWPNAQFSVDVTGLDDDDAVLARPVTVEYEAAEQGYLAVVRVNSHGELRLLNVDTVGAQGTIDLPISPPLGPEHTVFFFSDRPLDGLKALDLGADRPHAEDLMHKIELLQTQGVRVTSRQYDYIVDAPPGATQYTSRSIIREVEHGGSNGSSQRIPTRVEFEFNSDRLTAQGERDLDVFAAALLAHRNDRRVTLEGHTDAVGTDAYNQDLSERRARAAQHYLMESYHLPESEFVVIGKGREGTSDDSETERILHRRVDFIFSNSTQSR